VHLLRRLRQVLATQAEQGVAVDVKLASRIGERLAFNLMLIDDAKAAAEAVEVARATVEATPADPPSSQYARALTTYAYALLVEEDFNVARDWAERGIAAARAADAPWVEADALVTLGFMSNREGRNDEAIKVLTAAHRQAREAMMLGVELRSAYHLARAHLERGDLTTGGAVAHEGTKRAIQTGLDMSPYGVDLQHLHFQCHFADGKWDHAQEIADGFPVRVTSPPEASLSSMALFVDVARGNRAVEERRAWIEPFWSVRGFDYSFIAHGLFAEHALWQGDTDEALAEAQAAIDIDDVPPWGYSPSVLRPAAVALSARADRAVQARASGDHETARAEASAAAELIDIARRGAAFPKRPKFIMGPEGRGWLARAEAEYQRATGDNAPQAWEAVLDAFGPGYCYEIARTRWRLAEALAEAGRRDEANEQWRQAAQIADRLAARPLRRALDDLARRARIGTAPDLPDGAVLVALTSREREVLRLIAAGRSNREIASVLFIAPKTASVHVSNILGKLGAASRTEAAAIAHREGLTAAEPSRN
jgi:DNA-binding NarL/FixJ family response regulator